MIKLALASLKNRKVTTLFTLLAISLSITLVLGVERLRVDTRQAFTSTISGTDLIVGPRGSQLDLLLQSVFHLGTPTTSMSWQSYTYVKKDKNISWSVPFAFGDSHKGLPVVATTTDFFRHYKYANKQSLSFLEGRAFSNEYQVVVGANVAKRLDYHLGQALTLSHGLGKVSFHHHDQHQFNISGVLAQTGTPVDNALYIHLLAQDALHGTARPTQPHQAKVHQQDKHSDEHEAHHEHEEHHEHEAHREDYSVPDALNAAAPGLNGVFVGIKSKFRLLQIQRAINQNPQEPLMAVLPGYTLRELWKSLNTAEQVFRLLAWFVFVVSLISMLAVMLSSQNERRREMAILRATGAGAGRIFQLLLLEAMILMMFSAIVALLILNLGTMLAKPWLQTEFGLTLPLNFIRSDELYILMSMLMVNLLAVCIPAWRAYYHSLADGLQIRT